MPKSRWSFLELAEEEAEFPETPLFPHLTEWLLDVGPTWQGGMSHTAIPHSELMAWAANTATEFVGLEAEYLYKMSAAYASEINRADGKNVEAPHRGEG